MSKGPTGKRPKNCYRDAKSPFWQYDFTINGERDYGSTRCSGSREATAFVEARRNAMRLRQSSGSQGGRNRTPISIRAACELYAAVKKDPTTRYQLVNLVAILCADDEGRQVDDVTTGDLLRYVSIRRAMMNKRGVLNSGATVNREIQLARRVWRYAASLDHQIGDEPQWTKAIDSDAEVARVRELRQAEQETLWCSLERINPDLAVMALFALLCGQRKAAVIRLKWADVNFERSEATILLKGRGEKKRQHTFPLTPLMIEIIRSRPKIGPFVFTYECQRNAPSREDRPRRTAGTRFPFSLSGWTRQWRRAMREAGVEDFRWHDLRHTTASRLLRKVNNLEAVRKLLGHTTIAQTARYAHVNNDDLRGMMSSAEIATVSTGATSSQPDQQPKAA